LIQKKGKFMGPLSGLKVVEFAGIGPAPMCAMLLADLGATVIRVDRPLPADIGIEKPLRYNLLLRNRSSISVDLKRPEGVAFALELLGNSDICIEGFRPGTMERIGLGPDTCLAANPRLVYGRMTGWGQSGPLSNTAGHDLNYISLSGALHAIGRKGQPPTPPLNLVGDFGGGAMLLAFGLLAALHSAKASGKGQVVDAAMLDGAALLMTSFFGLHAAGLHGEERGTNILDSGAPYYDVYECADGRWLGVAPIERKFREEFLRMLGLEHLQDTTDLAQFRRTVAERIRSRSRDEWQTLFDGSDACVSPVLSMGEAPQHPQNRLREVFVEVDGVVQPAPAPRFSATPTARPIPPSATDTDPDSALAPWGCAAGRIAQLQDLGILRAAASLS
jgi:alpha-methylacyl-CoA racemase